jgi:hypothetical protein
LLVVAVGCDKDPPAPRTGSWDVKTTRNVSYEVDITSGGTTPSTKNVTLELRFRGGGRVEILLNGSDVGTFIMDERGVLTSDPPGKDAPVELLLLSAVPDNKSDLTKMGATWSRSYPDDADAHPDELIYRSTLSAQVTAVSPRVQASLVGRSSLVDNAGLRSFASAYVGANPPPEAAELLASFKADNTYLTGTLEFDADKGQVVSVSAKYIKFPRKPYTAEQIAQDPEREELTIRLAN